MPQQKPPPLDQLRTFVAVYRLGTFSDAARHLALSQPTVTNHIGALERWVGQELFVRTSAGVVPSSLAHEIAATVTDQIDHIDRVFAGRAVDESTLRSISIGGPAEVMTHCVIPALAPLSGRLPRIEMVLGQSGKLLGRLQAGELDLLISTVRPRQQGTRVWPLTDEEFWLVAAPDVVDPEASLSQLSRAPMVAYNKELAIVRRYWNSVFQAEPMFDATLVVPDLAAVKAAVVGGFGMSVLPSYLVAREVAAGELVRLDHPDSPPINTVFLVSREHTLGVREQMRPVIAAIVDSVKAYQRENELASAGLEGSGTVDAPSA